MRLGLETLWMNLDESAWKIVLRIAFLFRSRELSSLSGVWIPRQGLVSFLL